MTTLKEFLDTGHLGPLALGITPRDAIGLLGTADYRSEKANPLELLYGGLRLVFLRTHGPAEQGRQLREIAVSYLPSVKPLPEPVRFSDFTPRRTPTRIEFDAYLRRIGVQPLNTTADSRYAFLSGVTASFKEMHLDAIRLSERQRDERPVLALTDDREPTTEQIFAMLDEAERTLGLGLNQAAVLVAWAGLEAALRQAARRLGMPARIGIQPVTLTRQLLGAQKISIAQHQKLERFRQIRTAAAHGLAPRETEPHMVHELIAISRQLLH